MSQRLRLKEMVYGGFVVQGVGLMTAFVLYSRDRWPGVFTTRIDHAFASPTRPFQTVVAWGALLVAAWLGSGSLFSGGLYAMIISSVRAPLGTPGAELSELFGMLTGLVMGMCGAFLLAERSGVGDVQPAEHPLEGEDGERDRQPADHGHR
ncbi:hypothetical protein AB0K16_08535 [Nonomuraea jabiensis]|uniref:hypothetical protein n=1 Tax=Nonomuraea jabiensis TaxID=882448 RepID=UPI00342B803C